MHETKPKPLRLPGELSFKVLVIALAGFSIFDIAVYREISRAFARQVKQPPIQIEVDASPVRLGQPIENVEHRFTGLDAAGANALLSRPTQPRAEKKLAISSKGVQTK